MTKYKKDMPWAYPDWGQLHTPKVPKTIEHYLADIIRAAEEIEAKDYPSDLNLGDIIRYARRAWDLVPEEEE